MVTSIHYVVDVFQRHVEVWRYLIIKVLLHNKILVLVQGTQKITALRQGANGVEDRLSSQEGPVGTVQCRVNGPTTREQHCDRTNHFEMNKTLSAHSRQNSQATNRGCFMSSGK